MKLATYLVCGMVGATCAAVVAWLAGFSLFGILIAYVLAGMAGVLGAALIALLVS